MPKESGQKSARIAIQYFDGVNSTVSQSIARRTELSHAENARAPIIGVLEKREGQVKIGLDSDGGTFKTIGNYGLVYFDDGGTYSQGLIQIASENGIAANMYYLNNSDVWVQVPNDNALGLSLEYADFAKVDNNLVIVNGIDSNRMITGSIGSSATVSTSATAGSLYNSPRARKIAYYKSRIYLADYFNSAGTELKTTVLRSSYPMGVVSLLNGDLTAVDGSGNWVFKVTDTKYFYTASGMNVYEIYRGSNKIATITISSMTESTITATNANVTFTPTYSSFLSSDEVWINGTFSGEKQYRWVSNGTIVGRDVKQYDTFKISGGDEDPITMMETIGNVLMIANSNTMMAWNDYTLQSYDTSVGCCSRNGYIKSGGLYLLHYTGVYFTGGGVPQLVSRKVDRYIKGATKAGLEAGAMGKKDLSIFVAIGDSTLYNDDGSVQTVLRDVCLEMNTADQNWYVHTNVTASMFESYTAESGKETITMASVVPAKNELLSSTNLINNGSFTGSSNGWVLGDNWVFDDINNTMTFVKP